MENERSFLEVRVPKDSEETPEASSAFLSVFSNYKTPFLQSFLKGKRAISLEIILNNQLVHFCASVESEQEAYFLSQLTAQYPKALVNKTPDYVENWFGGTGLKKNKSSAKNMAAFGQLVLDSPYYFPLKTYQDFREVDPLSSILGVLGKAAPADKAIIQFIFVPAPASYSRSAQAVIDKGIPYKDQMGRIQKKPYPHAELISKKILHKAFRVGIRLATLSVNKEVSDVFLSHLAGAFGSFTLSGGNSLVLKKPGFGKKKFFDSIVERKFTGVPKYQYINIEELATLWHLPNVSLSKIKNIAWGGVLISEAPENLPISVGLTDEQKKEINFFGKTEFRNEMTNFGIMREDRRKHMYIIGKTGTGKTTLIANMAINDIRHGEGVAVIDPHGDLSEILLDYIPSSRINDVCYLDPSDTKHPFKLNILETKDDAYAELVASGIVAIFYKLYHYSWGPRLEYILRNAIMTLVKRPGSTLVDVPKLLGDASFRRKVIEGIDDPVLKGYWVNEFDKMGERLRSEAISPILNKVGQFVSSPTIRKIIGSQHSTIDFAEFMNEGKIVILNLSQGKLGEDNAALLGAMFITKMQLAAMDRVRVPEEQRRDFYLYVDEFQNFATSSFVKILSEARKYRLNLTVANQYIGQLAEDVMKAIFGNVGSLSSFVVGAADAGFLCKELGEAYESKDLVILGKYQIVSKLSIDNLTSEPFHAFTLPLPKCSNKNRQKIMKVSKERYTKEV